MSRSYKNSFLSACCLVLVCSCYNSEKSQANIFRYNEPTGISSIDPAFARNQSVMWAIHQLYNTLLEVDSQLHLKPSLARSWEISPDKRTSRFHLRTDVFFHNDACFAGGKGRRMTAADVVYSFRRLMDAA